jgi:hypothetical protein
LHKFIRSLDVEFVEDPSHRNRPEEIDVLVCMAHGEEIQRGSAELLLRNQHWTPILRDHNMMHSLVDGDRVISGLSGDCHGKSKGFTPHASHHHIIEGRAVGEDMSTMTRIMHRPLKSVLS